MTSAEVGVYDLQVDEAAARRVDGKAQRGGGQEPGGGDEPLNDDVAVGAGS